MIFVIDDDIVMAKCVARACKKMDEEAKEIRMFTNGIEAMEAISSGEVPDLIFLDVLLDGPDGFTFLNELLSYDDTMKIPVVIVTSLELSGRDLSDYGVVGVLSKETMRPEEMREYVLRYGLSVKGMKNVE